MNATLYTTDGGVRPVTPENGKDFKLEELYKLLKCDLVEVVYLNRTQIMIIDEEGKLRSEPKVNQKATVIAWKYMAIHPKDVVVGDAIVCDTKMFK